MEDVLIGTTDRSILVFIPDPASTTGQGKTGLNAAALTVTYTRVETDNDVVHNDVTSSLNDLSALTDAHNDWGLKEVSSTLSKGLYRLDLADAVFASGAWYAVVQVTITSGTAAATPKAFQLVAYNPLDGVRLGLTALPNAAADAAGGLIISDAGGLDADAQLVTKINDILTDTGTTLQGELDGIQADTEDIQSRLPAALVNSRMDCTIDATGMESGAVANIVAGVGLTLASGTIGATGNSTTALHLTGLTYGDDELNDYLIVIRDVSESEYHARWIEGWANAGDLATVATLPFTPQNSTDTYVILAIRQDVSGGSGLDAAGVRAAVGLASANLDTQLGTIDTNVDSILADTGTDGVVVASLANNSVTAAALAADAGTEIGTAVWATTTRLLTAGTNIQLPSNGLDNVTLPANIITATSIAANAITAAKIATDAITSSQLAASAVSEIQSGLSTHSAADVWAVATRSLTILDEDSTTLDLDGTIRAAVGLAAANLDTQLGDLPTAAENATAVLTTAMTESYSTDGSTATLAQATYLIMQRLTEFSISSTTVTIKKLDGSTTAATLTLDSATTPTSSTRAS